MIRNFLLWLQKLLQLWIEPVSLLPSILLDLSRSRSDLIAENGILRQQLILLNRQIKKPKITKLDRFLFVLLSHFATSWKQAIHIVQPDTLLRWHRELFRFYWRHKSKRTIQKYMPKDNKPSSSSQTWATFLKNQAGNAWACDFTVVYDWLFRPWYVFVIKELKTRRIVHSGVTNSPSDEWTAQQLREATPWGHGPKYLIHDRDRKFGPCFTAVTEGSNIEEVMTPPRTPQANGICERFMGSLRRDHSFPQNNHSVTAQRQDKNILPAKNIFKIQKCWRMK